MDGDGTPDFLVSNQNEPVAGAADAGTVRVYSSRDGALIHELFGPGAGARFGAALDAGLDADGDGRDEVLVSANLSGGPNGATNGMVYVLRRGDAAVVTYCPASPSGSGCLASVSTSGVASIAHGSPFEVRVTQVEGARSGFLFWSSKASLLPFAGGPQLRCVGAPAVRIGPLDAGGTAGECDGVLSLGFAAWARGHPRQAPVPGTPIHLQAWFTDPANLTGLGVSDAVLFSLLP